MDLLRIQIENKLRREPFNWKLRCDYGNCLYRKSLYHQALEQFKLLLEQKQLLQDAYLGLARCHYKLNKKFDAIHYYTEASKLGTLDEDPELDKLAKCYSINKYSS